MPRKSGDRSVTEKQTAKEKTDIVTVNAPLYKNPASEIFASGAVGNGLDRSEHTPIASAGNGLDRSGKPGLVLIGGTVKTVPYNSKGVYPYENERRAERPERGSRAPEQ